MAPEPLQRDPGTLSVINTPDLGTGFSFETLDDPAGITLRVVPAPASAPLLALGALLAARRHARANPLQPSHTAA